MNIYMTGASGTGKTMLATALSDRLGMYESPSVARTSPYKMKTQICQDYVMHCVDYQCRWLDEAVISRTPIDVFAYSYVWDLQLKQAVDVAIRFLEDNPIVLYLPKYWPTPSDGFRPTEGQDRVDRAIEYGLLTFYNYAGIDKEEANLYTVQHESVSDRADHVIEWMNEKGLVA